MLGLAALVPLRYNCNPAIERSGGCLVLFTKGFIDAQPRDLTGILFSIRLQLSDSLHVYFWK